MLHLELRSLLLIFTITSVIHSKSTYQHVGCFNDRPDRAISGGRNNYSPHEVIKRCYEKALNSGYSFFAVQADRECFTSINAERTYSKYGRTSGCRNGRGGSWRQDVYKIVSYEHVGCFNDRSSRAISGGFTVYSPHEVVHRCFEKAAKSGYGFFAVQYNQECFTHRDAGNTYAKYGRTTGCRNGRGGSWRQDVYKISKKDTSIGSIMGRVQKKYESEWNTHLNLCTGDCRKEYDSAADDLELTALGLESGEIFATMLHEGIKSKKFQKIARIAGKVAPFLGAMSPVVGILSTFVDTAEMQQLNFVVDLLSDGFQHINGRFDEIRLQLDDLKKFVASEHLTTRLTNYIQDLLNVNSRVEDYFKSFEYEEEDQRNAREDLIADESKVYDAIDTLSNFFLGRGSNKLCPSLIFITDVNRQRVMETVIPLYGRIVRGVSDLLLIEKLQGLESLHMLEVKYNKKLSDIYNLIAECDREIESKKWLEQWQSDLFAVMGNTGGGKESDLAERINSELTNKYYWRDWMIVVYGDVYGGSNHWIRRCTGTHAWSQLHWNKRYNIAVTSVSNTKSTHTSRLHISLPTKYTAKELYDRLPSYVRSSCEYQITGVLKQGKTTLAIRAPSSRMYKRAFPQRKCMKIWHYNHCWTESYFTVFILG